MSGYKEVFNAVYYSLAKQNGIQEYKEYVLTLLGIKDYGFSWRYKILSLKNWVWQTRCSLFLCDVVRQKEVTEAFRGGGSGKAF